MSAEIETLHKPMTKITRFRDIPKFVDNGNYRVNVSWSYLEGHLDRFAESCGEKSGLDLNPDFQRAHVWNEAKQIKFVEYVLRGGVSSRIIYFNCSSWMGNFDTPLELVDGKQRLEAARKFMRSELPVFGDSVYRDFTDNIGMRPDFIFVVNKLPTRAAVLQWYLDLNEGGVVHTEDELAKVRALLAAEKKA